MEQRLMEFIAGLRAAGVRVSVAESADSFRAVEEVGVMDRATFRAALRATLIKEPADVPAFDRLFPLYFGVHAAPMLPAGEGLTPEEQRQLMEALDALPRWLADLLRRMLSGQRLDPGELADLRADLEAAQADDDQLSLDQQQADRLTQLLMIRLAQLLNWLLSGQGPSQEELRQIGQQVGLQHATHPFQQRWLTRRVLRAMGMGRLTELLEEVLRQLSEAGVGEGVLQQLRETIRANAGTLEQQVNQFVGAAIARQATGQRPPPVRVSDLMQRPFRALSPQEAKELRDQVRRLAAQLRSRASLRHRRGKTGVLDPKATIRANLRYGGVPMEVRQRRRRLKPKLALICDVSTSVRPVVEFFLYLVYELQDQVARARSFAFIADIEEITQDFAEFRPEVAIQRVLERMPAGYYNTDLGYSLHHFCQEFLDAVDQRTTVIVLGDGRNNFASPRLDAFEKICRRARRVLWLNPEPPGLWGTGDSDMYAYLPYCDAAHEVGNLAQLAEAVDRLLTE